MSQLATRHNLKLNGLDPEQVTLLDSWPSCRRRRRWC